VLIVEQVDTSFKRVRYAPVSSRASSSLRLFIPILPSSGLLALTALTCSVPPAGLHHVPQLRPALPLAAIVVTPSGYGPARKLDDIGGPVSVFRVPRTNRKNPLTPALPGSHYRYVKAVVCERQRSRSKVLPS